jgi:hypothetical protein
MMGQPETASDIRDEHTIVPAIHHGIKVLSVGFFVERGAAVMWRGPMIHKLLTQFVEDVDWGELDYLVVDLPPGTGDTQLSLAQLVPVTGAVMVTTPQEVSVIDVEKALAMWKKVEVPVLGIIENMSFFACPKCGHHEEIFAHGGGRRLAEREGLAFLGEIPLLSAVRGAATTAGPSCWPSPSRPRCAGFFSHRRARGVRPFGAQLARPRHRQAQQQAVRSVMGTLGFALGATPALRAALTAAGKAAVGLIPGLDRTGRADYNRRRHASPRIRVARNHLLWNPAVG